MSVNRSRALLPAALTVSLIATTLAGASACSARPAKICVTGETP